MISVLILTRNEEGDLPACLASVAWSDDVHVFDSFSTDRTVAIAEAAGAHVLQRAFDGYASQRNAALAQSPFRHPWLLILDADERTTPTLNRELLQAAADAAPQIAAFRIRRRDFLWGTWLKHAQISPWYIRLVRPSRVHYIREVNELLEVDGGVGQLRQPLNHYPFSKGIAHWVAKHNTYSTLEAQLLASGAATEHASIRAALFAPDFHQRRASQKAIFYRLPFRPLLKWLYMMFFRGAVLDGPAGFAYSTLQAFYEYLIELKRREIISAQRPPRT